MPAPTTYEDRVRQDAAADAKHRLAEVEDLVLSLRKASGRWNHPLFGELDSSLRALRRHLETIIQ